MIIMTQKNEFRLKCVQNIKRIFRNKEIMKLKYFQLIALLLCATLAFAKEEVIHF